MPRERRTPTDVPDQRGRTAVITGASSGIGLDTARVLAARGATVVLAVRDMDKGARARAGILDAVPPAWLVVQRMDLASLDSVRAAAEELRATHPRLDLRINNAGVMHAKGGQPPTASSCASPTTWATSP